MVPPFILDISIRILNKKHLRIWLPLILLWPVLAIVYLLMIPFAAVAEIVLIRRGIRPLSILILLHQTLASLRGTLIDVSTGCYNDHTNVIIRFV